MSAFFLSTETKGDKSKPSISKILMHYLKIHSSFLKGQVCTKLKPTITHTVAFQKELARPHFWFKITNLQKKIQLIDI